MDADREDEKYGTGIGFHQKVSQSIDIITTVGTDDKVWSRLTCKCVGADLIKTFFNAVNAGKFIFLMRSGGAMGSARWSMV